MAFTKNPDYLLRRGSSFYLRLAIPADLRPHFLTASGKPKGAIVEALGTDSESKARELLKARLAYWWPEFKRMRKGKRSELPSDIRKAHAFRESMAEAKADNNEDAIFAIEGFAADHAEGIEQEAGSEAAQQFYAMATQPERLTLLQALGRMNESPDVTEATKVKREHAVRELLGFLKMNDCLPEYVTEKRAVSYVEWLNSTDKGYSTKQDRLSNFQTLWRYLVRVRQVGRGSSPWVDHELTGKNRPAVNGAGGEGREKKRGWKPEEMLTLFRAPDGERQGHYTRPLFRELYTLGFITGMRLDEIVSIRPRAVERIRGGYWIDIESSKTEAGVRGLPVVHKAAVAILKRRLEAQPKADESIFPECRPGGPDKRLSWHVQKAMGRDRDRLGFGPATDFHSTRRSFLTLMDNVGADVVHVQRYVGHRVPTLMHDVYSDGPTRENLRKVAAAVRYPAKVEAEFRKAAGL